MEMKLYQHCQGFSNWNNPIEDCSAGMQLHKTQFRAFDQI